MFQFRRFPAYAYFIQRTLTEYGSAGFPHSEIHGSTRMCRSPWLIAACHVLHRLLMPRHSPCALSSLTCRSSPRIMQALQSKLLPFKKSTISHATLPRSASVALLLSHFNHCSVFKVHKSGLRPDNNTH